MSDDIVERLNNKPKPSTDYAGLIERLRKDISDPTGKMMSDWDSWRKYIAVGGDSSWPRDRFEGHLDAIAEIHHSAADAIEALLAERDAAIEERDYVMAEGLFRDEQNEDLRKTVSKIWEQLGNPTYKELNGLTIHDLIDSVIYERNDIAARLREENERLREAFEKAANDMRPMLRSLISRNEAEEIVRRAARAAIEGVTEKSGAENE